MMCCLLATSPKKWSQTSRITKKMHQQVDLKRNHNRWSLTVPYHIQRCLEKMDERTIFWKLQTDTLIMSHGHMGMENPDFVTLGKYLWYQKRWFFHGQLQNHQISSGWIVTKNSTGGPKTGTLAKMPAPVWWSAPKELRPRPRNMTPKSFLKMRSP